MKTIGKEVRSVARGGASVRVFVWARAWIFVGLLATAISAGAASPRTRQGAAANNAQQIQQDVATEKQAVQTNPKDYMAWFKLGNDYYNLGQYAQALSAYQQSTSVAPSNADLIWYGLGNAYTKLQQYQNATDAYQQSVIKGGRYEPAWFQLGYAEGIMGNYVFDAAAEQQAVALNPQDESAWIELSFASNNSGKPADGIQAAMQATKLNPQDATGWLNLGVGYCMQHDVTSGLQQIPTLQKLNAQVAQRLQSYCSKQGSAQTGTKR